MLTSTVGVGKLPGTDSSSESAFYSEWKGWGSEAQFGKMDRGDFQYFTRELRDVTKQRSISRVLEVGFGNGVFLAYCRARGWDVTGTELSPELVAAATTAGYAAYPADRMRDIPDEHFDLIVAFDVFEHIPSDNSVDFLSALASKLRPDGAMLLRFPNADSWLGNPLQNGDPTHVSAIGFLKMTYFAARANLKIVRFRGQSRRGFSTSVIHGLHALIAGPIVATAALVKRVIYFPALPVVLSAPNVVCVVERVDS